MKNILFIAAALLLLSCTVKKNPVMVENSGRAQGSTYQIKYLTDQGKNFAEEIEDIFREIDLSMSTYIPDSEISTLNKGGEWVEVDPMFQKVLGRAIEIAEETNGDFDPTVGPLVAMWGFGFEKVRGDVGPEKVAEVKSKTGFSSIERDGSRVRIPKGFSIDFNAIAQGFTVDHIAEYLESEGIESYMVEVGGEVRTKGKNSKGKIWTIGVDKPQSTIDAEERFQFILELNNAGLATSGNYRKFWVDEETGIKYSHTIDPHTGVPARNRLLSASLVAPEAMDADAYATVCMVRGLEGCKELLDSKPEIEGYLVFTNDEGDWDTFITDGFKAFIVN